jgi:peptidoglycan/LPS O-acetylase OafA/YrhL
MGNNMGTLQKRKFFPQLDALRALAVFAVMLSHFAQVGVGEAGVRLFFVLSGFLITGILLDSRERIAAGGALGQELKMFYIRRSIRIFPIYYLVLFLTAVRNVTPARETFFWHFFYLTNVGGFVSGRDFGMLTHFWSLSVEEQFYSFWPFLILLLPRKYFMPLLLSLVLLAPIFRDLAFAAGWHGNYVWLLPSQLDALGLGALLALCFHRTPTRDGLQTIFPTWIAFVSGVIALICQFWQSGLAWNLHRFCEVVFFAWLVGGAAIGFGGMFGWLLNLASLRYLGRISYGIYVYHNFANFLAHKPLRLLNIPYPHSLWLSLPLEIGVSIGCASISWHFLEKPLNSLKDRFRPSENGRKPLAESSVTVHL